MSNILQTTSWLDHGLVTIVKMLSPKVNKDLKDLILSNAKFLQFLRNNTATTWVSLLPKQRDAVLALALRLVPNEEHLESGP